jgi:host factor-I protein
LRRNNRASGSLPYQTAPLPEFGAAGAIRNLPLVSRTRAGSGREELKLVAVHKAFALKKAKEIGMENKPAQNIQDSFLNTARKERLNITIYLVSGVKLTGRIRSFDKYSVVLETNNQEQLIFKHAISTVAMGRVGHAHGEKPAPVPVVGPAAEPNPTPSASGTEG